MFVNFRLHFHFIFPFPTTRIIIPTVFIFNSVNFADASFCPCSFCCFTFSVFQKKIMFNPVFSIQNYYGPHIFCLLIFAYFFMHRLAYSRFFDPKQTLYKHKIPEYAQVLNYNLTAVLSIFQRKYLQYVCHVPSRNLCYRSLNESSWKGWLGPGKKWKYLVRRQPTIAGREGIDCVESIYMSYTLCIWPDSEPTKLLYHPKQISRRVGDLRQINTCRQVPLLVNF